MEIELKYLVENVEMAEKIFSDEKIAKCLDKDSKKIYHMHAIYFDTESGSLSKSKVAIRVRRESLNYVATVKWGGGSEEGLHIREEVNVDLGPECPSEIGAKLFDGTLAYEMLEGLIGKEDLVVIAEMKFDRTEYRLDTGKSASAISYDMGTIFGKSRNESISEIEIELVKGDQGDIVKMGKYLEEKYEVKPCNVSKLARGISANK